MEHPSCIVKIFPSHKPPFSSGIPQPATFDDTVAGQLMGYHPDAVIPLKKIRSYILVIFRKEPHQTP